METNIMNAELSSREKFCDYIRNHYKNDGIYEILITPYLKLFEFKECRLEYPEYYYLVIKTLDRLKRCSSSVDQTIVVLDLEKNLIKFMSQELGILNPQKEVIVVIGFIFWLIGRSQSSKYNGAYGPLLHIMSSKYSDLLWYVEQMCYRSRDEKSFEEYNQWVKSLKNYLDNKTYYSEEIDAQFGYGRDDEEDKDNQEEENKCPYRIAKTQKQNLLSVLNAIYLAGWITDQNGNKLEQCRDDVLNHILLTALGETKYTLISQNLNPSSSTKEDKQLNALEELIKVLKQNLALKRRRKKGI